jgi:uncharacterized RDD family membrane protein YckC
MQPEQPYQQAPPAPPATAHADPTEVVGRRIGALLLDSILLGVVFVVLGIITGGAKSGDNSASVNLGGGPFVLFLAITLAYFVLCEGTSGQTLGKRALSIRVVSEQGSKAGWGQVTARNVLRVIDSLPAFYIVGLITVLITGRGRHERIGDIAGHTRVVHAQAAPPV